MATEIRKGLFTRGTMFVPILKNILVMAKQRKTSKSAATAASKVLKDKRTGKNSKKAAGSALSQRAPKKKK